MGSRKAVVSELDHQYYAIIRANVSKFINRCAQQYDRDGLLLDIAPQIHEGAAPYFVKAKVFTLDIDPTSNADYIADICACNEALIPSNYFDWIVCTEVLEHTLNPFAAVTEMIRILMPGGLLFITTPFNFRIHGPLPDCWRFTEHGLRTLLSKLEIVELNEVPTPERDLMPIHYTVIAQK